MSAFLFPKLVPPLSSSSRLKRRISMSRSSSSPINPSRIRSLNPHVPTSTGQFILYWMNNSVRTRHNPALEHAASLSNHFKKPLRTAYCLDVTALDGRPMTERHALFLLQGLADVKNALRKRHVSFVTIDPGVPVCDAVVELARGAAAVVTDACYLRRGIDVRNRVAAALDAPLYVVEADVVVPVEEVTDKAEHAARTIRPKITRLLPEHLVNLDSIELQNQQGDPGWVQLEKGMDTVDVLDVENVLSGMPGLDRGGRRVNGFTGGQVEAEKVLDAFLRERLSGYGKGRNEPVKQLQSDLSPYLRAGNISPVEVALRTKAFARGKGSAVKESEASFLEELIVRRELAANACWFNQDGYDLYERIVPAFAQASLEEHKKDKRPQVYTYEQLEAGLTSDPYWNAAQLEMVVRGKMHGYMRMYWAKQILGWVEDPKDAMDYALRLNNRWELDAVDPNSYVGVIWCFGLHDQGWKERAIWGKVRYMNDTGLKRKFNMPAYLALVDLMVAKEGLPSHIAKMRKQAKVGPQKTQQTIQQSLKRALSTPTKSKRSSTTAKLRASAAKRAKSNAAAREALRRSIEGLNS
eukprot:GFKZ01009665.1.p1 GENE.GFKZ01009665.1~~GFKZ01009665.1.p1  ORF type:complete len:581 (+),score=76.83 GFKZ01009665.1:259-2001(+)